MKKYLISSGKGSRYHVGLITALLLSAVIPYYASGQKCAAEILATKPDDVIQKDFTNVGRIGKVHISVEIVSDLTNNKKINALEMEYTFGDNNTTVSVLLDAGETDTLLNFIDFVSTKVAKSLQPSGDREFSIVSRSGFEAGAYWNSGWKTYIKIDSQNDRTNVEMTREDWLEFQSLVKQARLSM